MEMTIYGKQINMNDKLVETYNMAASPNRLKSNTVEFLIRIYRREEAKNVRNLGKRELTKLANETLLHELKELEILSRPETTQKAIAFYKSKMGS